MNMRTIMLWGPSGSGKTTTAANLALAIAGTQRLVGLITSNLVYGELQILFKTTIPEQKGLGIALAGGDTKNMFVQAPCRECLYLLGMPNHTDALVMAGTTMRSVTEMLEDAAIRFDCIIIDGSSEINNPVSSVGLVKSDQIYTVCRPCARTIAWKQSVQQMASLLNVEDKLAYLLNADDRTCDRKSFLQGLGVSPAAELPYEERMPVCENSGIPLYLQNSRHGREYKAVLDGLAEDIIR